MILYIILGLIVGFVLGISVVAWRVGAIVSVERGSCAASKRHLEEENRRLWAENEEMREELDSLSSLHSQPEYA